MSSNPNATAAAITAIFVEILNRLLYHYNVVDFTPQQVLLVAGAATTLVLLIGRDGIWPSLLRLWSCVKAVAGVKNPPPAPPPATP